MFLTMFPHSKNLEETSCSDSATTNKTKISNSKSVVSISRNKPYFSNLRRAENQALFHRD